MQMRGQIVIPIWDIPLPHRTLTRLTLTRIQRTVLIIRRMMKEIKQIPSPEGMPRKQGFRSNAAGFAQVAAVKGGFAILRSKTQRSCALDGRPTLSSSMYRTPTKGRAFRPFAGDAQRRAYLYFDRTKSRRWRNKSEFGATIIVYMSNSDLRYVPTFSLYTREFDAFSFEIKASVI